MRMWRIMLAAVLGLGGTAVAVAGPSICGTAPAAAAAAATPHVWIAGDSTVANPGSSGACPVGWGNRIGTYLVDGVTVHNSAVGGRSVQTWLYEGNVTATIGANGECVLSAQTYSARWQAMLTGMAAGDYLFVQFGINDGSATCPRHVGPARYQELLRTMAAAAKQRGVTPVFLTPVAAIRCSGATAVGNRGFLAETRAAGAAAGATVIDLHARSVALYNTLKLCPNNGDYSSGAVGAFFCNDHTHFEAAGAQRIAGLVAAAIREQGIGLSAYLR